MRLTTTHRIENAHEDAVWTACWTPADSLITGSVDETVKVWTGATGENQHTYTGHTLGVTSVAVDASGTHAASSALDSFIRVWTLAESQTKAVMETPPSETWQICFHPTADTPTIAAAGGSANGISLWDWENARLIRTVKLPGSEERVKKEKFVLSVACSLDGRRLACGAQDGTVCLYDSETGTLLKSLEGHYKPVRGLAFTPDSSLLLTACDDMHAHLYDVEAGSLIEAFSGHESWVLSVSCHPSGTSFATGSSDSKVRLWDIQTRTCAQTINDHTDQVWQVAFSKDGGLFSSVSDDKSIGLYSYVA